MKTQFIFFTILILFATSAIAQPSPPATPVDGGLSVLLSLAGIYGIRKIVRSGKN